jgi:hypothetical protein
MGVAPSSPALVVDPVVRFALALGKGLTARLCLRGELEGHGHGRSILPLSIV